MKIVGLDLSLAATGWAAAADSIGGHSHGVIATTSSTDLPLRLDHIADRVEQLAADADLIVVEDLPKNVKFGGTSLGMVHGVVRHLLWAMAGDGRCGPTVLVPPASLKTFATGRGNASKPDIRMEVFKRFYVDIADDNACDAYVLRAMALDHYGQPLADLPQTHRRALDKVEWPTLNAQETPAA
jgi:Holliday junction resolvasome RuvABC endonuclease subunit